MIYMLGWYQINIKIRSNLLLIISQTILNSQRFLSLVYNSVTLITESHVVKGYNQKVTIIIKTYLLCIRQRKSVVFKQRQGFKVWLIEIF